MPACTVSDAIEELGAGRSQWLVALVTGAMHFLGGSLTMMVTSLSDVHKLEWNFSPFKNGFLASAFFVGCVLGDVFGGMMGDHCGRKQPIIAGFCLAFASCCCGILAQGFWSLVFFRVLMGIGIDIGQAPAQTMMAECTPAAWRLTFSTVKIMMFTGGEMLAATLLTLDDPQLVHVHWRLLTAAVALPAAAAVPVAAAFLNQSPVYLASIGRYQEAEEAVCDMRRQNGLPAIALRLAPEESPGGHVEVTFARQVRTVFGRRLLSTTLIGWFCIFFVDGIHFGAMGAFAKAMVQGVSLGGRPSISLMMGTWSETVGYLLIIPCAGLPRKLVLFTALMLEAVCLSAFAVGARYEDQGWVMQSLAMFGFYGAKLGNPTCLVVFYVYLAEVYPTRSRTLGVGLAMGAGRLGDVFAPAALEVIMSGTSVDVFFWLCALLHIVAALLVRLLPYETLGNPLPEDDYVEVATEATNYGAAGGTLQAAKCGQGGDPLTTSRLCMNL